MDFVTNLQVVHPDRTLGMLRRGRFVSIASVHRASEAEEWFEKRIFAEI